MIGIQTTLQELRRISSGRFNENHRLVTMHDVLDATYQYTHEKDETYLREIIQPLEYLLLSHKRIMIKDTCINSLCYGAKLMSPGLLRFSSNIKVSDEIVVITTKGEAVCIGIAVVSSSEMMIIDHGEVCHVKRVIMDRDCYP